jgi:uncharacterized protein YdeI (YjbR/CyaY-like superfamily)
MELSKHQTLDIPEDLLWALDANAQARAVFDKFSNAHRREYIRWIEGARQPITRARRLQEALEMMIAEKRGRTA